MSEKEDSAKVMEETSCVGEETPSSSGTKRPADEDNSATNKLQCSLDNLSKAELVHRVIFKDIRKSSDSRYDHSSALLKKTALYRRSSSKRKISLKSDTSCSKIESQNPSPVNEEGPTESQFYAAPLTIESQNPSQLNEEGPTESVAPLTVDEINPVHSYVHALKYFRAFSPCDSTLHQFVMQDYNLVTADLKRNQFVFVGRRSVYFKQDVRWIFWCSCNISRTSLITSISHHVEDTAFNLKDECLHVAVARVITEELDTVLGMSPYMDFSDHNYSQMSPDHASESNFTSLGVEPALCVNVNNDFGVLCLGHNKSPFCSSCKHNSSNCKHISYLRKALEDSSVSELPPQLKAFSISETSSTYQPHYAKAVSNRKIQFNLTSRMKQCLKADYSKRFNIQHGIAHLHPPLSSLSTCPDCAIPNSWSQELILVKETFLVAPQCCFPAKVSMRKCTTPSCDGILAYDGQEDCVLNMNVFLIAYEVLRSHMFHFLHGRTTMYTEFTILQRIHSDMEEELVLKSFKYNHFRCAWYSFLALLDIDYSESFSCSICGNKPQTIIMDATSVSFRRELDSWHPIIALPARKKKLSGRFNDRVFIPNKKARSLLLDFSKGGIQRERLSELDELLTEHCPSMSSLFGYLQRRINLSLPTVKCPSEWAGFLSALASPSAVCGLIHPSEKLFSILRRIHCEDITKDIGCMSVLQTEVPVLFNLLRCVTQLPVGCLPQIIERLIEKSMAPFIAKSEDTIGSGIDEDSLRELSYFPSLPKIRIRGLYSVDSQSRKASGCTKQSSGHPTLLPGIFTVYCPHGVCYGFEVMRVHESPNVPFTVMYTRLLEAPSTIVYDNACNLHNYCLNREPNFFKKSWFVVDRFHWRNHTSCSVGYNMASYPQFTLINSEVVEQANSMIQRTKGSLSYMTSNNFINHLKFFFWYHNKQCKQT